MNLEYASRVLAKDGEARSGDAVFARVDASSALFVLLDALGHGDAAALVAERSMQVLSELPLFVRTQASYAPLTGAL